GDPINRVDPSGEAWWDWLLAGIGLIAAIAATVGSAGTFAGVIAGAGTTLSIMTTSSGATAAAAALADIIATTAELGSVASLAVGDTEAGSIFGWIAIGAGFASAGAARAATKLASGGVGRKALATFGDALTSETGGHGRRLHEAIAPMGEIFDVPQTLARRGVRPPTTYHASAYTIDASRFDVHMGDASGSSVRLRTKLYRAGNGTRAVHYGTDMPTTISDQRMMLGRVASEHPTGPIFFYGAKHGKPSGLNWSNVGGRIVRIGDVPGDVLARQRKMFSDLNASTLNGRGQFDILVDAAQATQMFKRPGSHVHPECFGIIDEFLARTLGYDPPPAIASHLHVIF
ncbi:hypothetical protein, partial [Luteibacter yeojuensis]